MHQQPTGINCGSFLSVIRRWAVCVLVIVALLQQHVSAFYLPGTAPQEYRDGDPVEMQVNVLTAINTHLPYDYYSLPVCHPTRNVRASRQNLGEVLMGDRRKPSPYEDIVVEKNVQCAVVCPAIPLEESMRRNLHQHIKDDYHLNFILDNLPLAMVHPETSTFAVGVPLGSMEGGVAYVHNHLHFTIRYYEMSIEEVQHQSGQPKKGGTAPPIDDDEYIAVKRIVAFIAKPMSVRHDPLNPTYRCNDVNFSTSLMDPQRAMDANIIWSYGVTWERSDERWATRWDVYLNVEDQDIHWFSIVNSTLIVLFLSAMVAVIIMRAVRRDISSHNRAHLDPEDLQEETGWKMIHKDVFRPPVRGDLLAALAGTGVQMLGDVFVVLIVACLGFLSPANRGALFTLMLAGFVMLGVTAGYVASRLLRLWDMPSWRSIFLTAVFVPGIAFSTFSVINMAVWSQGSAGAVPFSTIVAIIAMWVFVSLPLVFVGAIWGFKKDPIKLPVSTNQVPRHIPQVAWHLNPLLTISVGGILPFGAVFIEAFFILSAVWLNRYYYVFGFLFLVMLILIVTCAEITIVMCYFQLCAEDYRWWWRSFLTSGSCGGYLYIYSVFYFFTSSMKMTRVVSIIMYFGYMGLLSLLFAIMMGTVGFAAAFVFTRYIYSSIKVD